MPAAAKARLGYLKLDIHVVVGATARTQEPPEQRGEKGVVMYVGQIFRLMGRSR